MAERHRLMGKEHRLRRAFGDKNPLSRAASGEQSNEAAATVRIAPRRGKHSDASVRSGAQAGRRVGAAAFPA